MTKFEESLFCLRLKQIAAQDDANTRMGNLVNATRRLLENASAISKQIVRFLPQFTSHDEVHLWNVLGFMEQLAGGKTAIDQLDAGDCAMAVWAAFIHDLGMVIEAGELAAIDQLDEFDSGSPTEPSAAPLSDERTLAWRAYREGHEHWDSIRKDPTSGKSQMRLGLIRAAYVRDSHAREDAHTGSCRIADWLSFLATGDRLISQTLDDFAIATRLVRVAVSHNQEIHWLERQLHDQLHVSDPHAEMVDGVLGTVHWTWIGWLLRLADVFDCDKSRTPRILFDHGGITDSRSQTEWQKHLSIPSPPLWPTEFEQSLLYICTKCPSPIVEKAIHQIIGWMNDEIDKVRGAKLAALTKGAIPDIKLPSQAKIEIKQREGGYIYHDMEFRLDRNAVVELLMGESLYGGPELALREMVQNALDAVHLRDQRNKLAEELNRAGSAEKPRQPHEPWQGVKPGVEVTWGETEGKRFISVSDNGVGMTVATMRKFLTQIGKSYYKSDDFRAEQEMMRRHGILCTAISQFGIGFLSVFMLADHVTIHTRPVGASDKAPADPQLQETARFPFRAEIHGPHGLLAFYPDSTIQRSGTKVTIWLKDQFVLAEWNRGRVLKGLYEEFYASKSSRKFSFHASESKGVDNRVIDPALEIGKYIVWPLYPVSLVPTKGKPIVLSDVFHAKELCVLNHQKLKEDMLSWECNVPESEAINWRICDWTDSQSTSNGVSGTGSRIRVMFADFKGMISKTLRPDQMASILNELPSGVPRLPLLAMVDHQLPPASSRYSCLVNGVRITPGLEISDEERDCKLSLVIDSIKVLPGSGAFVWIDLRGAAMPRLRADRTAPTCSQSCESELVGLSERWLSAWPDRIPSWIPDSVKCKGLIRPTPVTLLGYVRILQPAISPTMAAQMLYHESTFHHNLNRNFPYGWRDLLAFRDCSLPCEATQSYSISHNLAVALCTAYGHNDSYRLSDSIDSLVLGDRDYIGSGIRVASSAVHQFSQYVERQSGTAASLLRSAILTNHVSEGLWPSVSSCHPAFALAGSNVELQHLKLAGPLHVSNEGIRTSDWLSEYDLCVPFTAIPLPRLKERFPEWTNNRGWRAILTLPFLRGCEPLETWRDLLDEDMPVEHLMLFIPAPRQYEWKFDSRTRMKWSQGSASAIWDLKTGHVLYADGVHTEASLRQQGKPLRTWLSIKDK